MAEIGWMWEEDGCIEINTQPASLTYCSTLNCIILTSTEPCIDIIDVNSGEIVRRNVIIDKNAKEESCHGLLCVFNPTSGNLTITDGTRIGLRKDLNGIYLLNTILQTPLQEMRDGEIVVEMTLPDLEHVASGLQVAMKHANEPQLTMMEKASCKLKETIKNVKSKISEDADRLQKWATCQVHVDGEVMQSTLTHTISLLQTVSSKGPQLSSTSALLSQINNLLPSSGAEQGEVGSNKKKMWSEANRRKTFCTWPHKDYKWAVPETMAQAGFYHQSDRRMYPNSVDRAVCFTCNVGLVCWEPTDEPWSEHERHSPNCPFVRGECTENVPLSVTVATAPAQFHNEKRQKIACVSPPSSVPLMASSTSDGHVVAWDIRDELEVRSRMILKVDDKILANEIEEVENVFESEAAGEVNKQRTKETLEEESESGGNGSLEDNSAGIGNSEGSLSNLNGNDDNKPAQAEVSMGDSKHFKTEVTSLGVLKNEQELGKEETQPLVPEILSEAMLVVGAVVTISNESNLPGVATDVKSYLLTLEIPPDKNKPRPKTKSEKANEEKVKPKPASYSTQLSFESDDEFYDPLFSSPMPHDMFQKISSSTKDAFTSELGEKTDEGPIKTSRVVQCLGVECFAKSDGFVVTQVLPYHDGEHVLVAMAKRKQTGNELGSTSMRGSDNDISRKHGDVSSEARQANGSLEDVTVCEAEDSNSDNMTLCNKEDVNTDKRGSSYEDSAQETACFATTWNNLTHNDGDVASENVELESQAKTTMLEDPNACTREVTSSDHEKLVEGETGSVCSEQLMSSILDQLPTTLEASAHIPGDLETADLDNTASVKESRSSEVCQTEHQTFSCSDTSSVAGDVLYSSYLLLYKTRKIKGRTLLEDHPCKTISNSTADGLRNLFLLPEEAEESFNPGLIEANLPQTTYLAGIAADGCLVVMDGLSLDPITRFPSDNSDPGNCYRRVVFCSGLGSFCACTENGKLHFLHLLKNTSQTERASSSSGLQIPSKESVHKESSKKVFFEDLCLTNLKSLVEMTTFENLVPRYTAIVPVFWSEIQQEQQQRRHPQHLLQNSQGDASCHTRTWKLQKKGLVGGDQLFELMLPRPCYVGHVDIKFTVNKSTASKNNVQVILSKPRSSSLRTKPTQAFTVNSSQQMKGDLICGPVDLSEHYYPYGDKGHVVLTSPALLRTKVRTLYVIFKSRSKSCGTVEEGSGGRNGFSDLEEISITVRSLTSQFNADLFGTLLETQDFCPRLMDIVCKNTVQDVCVQEEEDLQWFALELLCWIAGISAHQPVSETSLASLVVKRFPTLIQSCFLTASRSIAHKCSRLVVLCLSQISSDGDGSLAKSTLIKAFLDALPGTISSESIGGINWLFTLLTGMLSTADVNIVGRSCVELLMKIAQQLDGKLTYVDRILRANFSLYGTPLDPSVFDVSTETLGLFATSKLSDDLLDPKNSGKASTDNEEVDLMDYVSPKHNGRSHGSVTKVEKFLSSVYGILEVEPLEFGCSSMSDGCKVESCHSPNQPGVNGGIGSLYYANTSGAPDGLSSTPMTAIQDHVQQLKEHEKLLSKLQKQKQQLEEQHQELEELGGILFPSTPPQKNAFYDDYWFTGKKMTSPQFKFPSSSFGAKSYGFFNNKPQSRSTYVNFSPHHYQQTYASFQLPVPKLLTIEKLQTGSRHFVVLDFGQSVRLTDIFIPPCPDLSSLVIDIWVDGEEKDLTRVTVSTDIGTKALLLTDLLPPLTCRYLKISLFARHGTLRTKLILGEFFGYPVYSDLSLPEEKTAEPFDVSRQSYHNMMYDDVFCQYGVACLRLESVLNSLEPGFVNGRASSANDKASADDAKVRQAYSVCMNLQLRLNFLKKSLERILGRQALLSSLHADVGDTETPIQTVSYNKLKVISDWLVHVLISLFGVDEPAENGRCAQEGQWFNEISLDTCKSLFTTFCVKGTSASRARVGAMLLRSCGEQAWWGSFLAWVMEEFFSTDQTMLFSRERLFLLLTSMSQLSLLQCSVVTSALSLLQKLLTPVLEDTTQNTSLRPFDTTLLEWVTLYVSNLLENFMEMAQENPSKHKDSQGTESDAIPVRSTDDNQNATKKWDFIVPRAAGDPLRDSLKDVKGSKKEIRKIKKQIAIRQKRLQVLHQQHLINKAQFFEEYGSTSSMLNPPSPFQITQWNKQFRQKAKKPLKDLLRLKRLMADSSSQPAPDNQNTRCSKKLPCHLCLPVMRGLLTVLLSHQGTCNVDFFVLICKVLGCLTMVSHPRVSLVDLASERQLEQLLRMCVREGGVPAGNWSPGDQWIKHACTSLLQDLICELRPYTVQEVSLKPKEETKEVSISEATNDGESDTSSGDVQDIEEPGEEEISNFNEWFGELSLSSDITELKVTSKLKEAPVVFSTVAVPTPSSPEISTAEDCRLEISVEMSAERELRRLAFSCRQRFLTGMDVKSGVVTSKYKNCEVANAGIVSGGIASGGISTVGIASVEIASAEIASAEIASAEIASAGIASAGIASAGTGIGIAEVKGVECGSGEVNIPQVKISGGENGQVEDIEAGNSGNDFSAMGELNVKNCVKVGHLFSQCLSKLVMDSFKGFYNTDSVLELCLLLNIDSTADEQFGLFLITEQAMETSLLGLCTVEDASARSWNIAINWLRMLVSQCPRAFSFQPTDDTHKPYATASKLVGNPRFSHVIGHLLTASLYGDSGMKALGPSAVGNLRMLFKELVDLTSLKERGISTSILQELLLDVLLYITAHNDETRFLSAKSQPFDLCIEFLEFFSRSFPVKPPLRGHSKPVVIIDSILSIVLLYLSFSHQILCSGNSSKKRLNALFENQGLQRESNTEASASKLIMLYLKVLGKLLPLSNEEASAEASSESSLADCLVRERPTMGKLLACLNMCRGESVELVEIGLNILSSDLSEMDSLDKPTSVEDGVMKTFFVLHKHTKNKEGLISAMLEFFSENAVPQSVNISCGAGHMSELLLWVFLKLLDSDDLFRIFYENGGIDIICRKLSLATARALHPVRGIVSTVVHELGVKTQRKSDAEKSLLAAAWATDKSLVNFATFASIQCSPETSSLPDSLITMSAPSRRGRSAVWTYRFTSEETWCTLTITLPNTIIVHEVVIQPHAASLLNSTSYVTLELGHEGYSVSKISAPLLTAGLSNIRLQLTTPELASVLKLRFHRPRDSDTLGLNRIEVLGTSFYGPSPAMQANLQSQKASLNWSRALDYCLRRSHVLSSSVLKTLSETDGILGILLKVLWSFPCSNLKSGVEFILIKLASYSPELCTKLLTQILYCGRVSDQSGGCLAGSLGVADNSNSENELLYQLGILKDSQAWSRLKTMCDWLLYVQEMFASGKSEHRLLTGRKLIPKIRTITSIIWLIKDEHDMSDRLQSVITEEKFRDIYHWAQSMKDIPMFKLTVDHLIGALCHALRPYFQCLLDMSVPSGEDNQKSSRADVKQENGPVKDHNVTICKEGDSDYFFENSICAGKRHMRRWYRHPRSHEVNVQPDFSALMTLARSSLTTSGGADLLRSGLVGGILERIEKTCRRFTRGSKKVSDSVEQVSIKASEDTLEELRGMLEFLTSLLDECLLKEWLGCEEGNYFWHSLLTFLADCHPRAATRPFTQQNALRYSPINPRVLSSLQTTVLRFFKKCVAGHVDNQRNLACALHELLARDTHDATQGVKTLSGFVRRLVLELLLDEDHVMLVVTCAGTVSQGLATSCGSAFQSPLWHPRFGTSNACRLRRVRVTTTMHEVINLIVANPLPNLPKVGSGTTDSSRKSSEGFQDVLELLELGDLSKHEAMTLASSAINVKNKRSNHGDKIKGETSSNEDSVNNARALVLPCETWMSCETGPLAGVPLPKETTVAQIMESLNHPCPGSGTIYVRLRLSSPADPVATIPSGSSSVKDVTALKSVPTLLEAFSSLGGLALIAEHLPPRFSVAMSLSSPRVITAAPLYSPAVMSSAVPGHSLMGFTMFLRLPGYADILLENQQNARFMLRLILGVEDDGEGGHIPSLPAARGLPTLPFNILEKLLKLNPVANETGACLRQTALDIGVVHLLLTSLGLLSHHKPREMDNRHEATMDALKAFSASNDLHRSQSTGSKSSKQYWAKGTGFGTGSTSSGWDIEQALVKQKNEEEHITWILQVLASFICPVGVTISAETNIDDIPLNVSDEDITNVLPTLPEILMNSCLIPTLASYLRNDSVLDMARHVPLYRAVLGFVRCIAVSPNLIPLLQPSNQTSKESSNNGDTASLCSLLTKMKLCVDTYGNRLRSSEKVNDANTGRKDGSPRSSSTKADDVENESLSLLIPDVQTTSMLVHKAVDRYRWEHLKAEGSNDAEGSGEGTGEEQMSPEERYSSVMMPLQFDTFAIVSEGPDGKLKFNLPFHYSNSVKSSTSSGQRVNAGRARRLAQEIASLSTSLPLSYSSSVFVRCDEERLDLMKVLITGPADTPYANGCFEFDVYFPPDYPSNPMHISFETTGNHRIRFNPNLYNDGKVCLSILNTWHGRPEEKWNSQTSSFLQVIERHFFLKKVEVLRQCDEWIRELEAWSKEKRTMRSITHHLESLRRHTTQLREAISKISPDCLNTDEEKTE